MSSIFSSSASQELSVTNLHRQEVARVDLCQTSLQAEDTIKYQTRKFSIHLSDFLREQ